MGLSLFLKLLAAGFSQLLLVTSAAAQAQTVEDIFVTANGEHLMGESIDGIAVFRGVPFAQPPVGDLRWRAPLPPVPRSGPQLADSFSPACMQADYIVDWYADVIEAFDGERVWAARPSGFSEDCLYLNIWSPQPEAGAGLPVMVYVHGGNNQGGWSYEPNYMGEALAVKGVVVVSVSYRQHVFGFMAHPELTAESSNRSSGSYGLLDLIAALQWVKQNIEQFGGDSSNVTLFGESMGAVNIGYLMLTPLTRGLYRNVIRQSGAFDVNYRDHLDQEEKFGSEFVVSMGVDSIAELKKIPSAEILSGAEAYYQAGDVSVERNYFYGPVDGYLRSQPVVDLYRSGRINPGNLLLGSNADEKLMYTAKAVSEEDVLAFIERYFKSEEKDKVLALLSHLTSNRRKLATLKGAQEQKCTARLQADAFAEAELGSVYMYEFSRVRPGIGGERLGAYHGAELPYVFDTHDDWLPTEDIDRALTQTIMNYWVNFAKTGNPNGPGLSHWPQYDASERTTQELGDAIKTIEIPFNALCDLIKPPQPA